MNPISVVYTYHDITNHQVMDRKTLHWNKPIRSDEDIAELGKAMEDLCLGQKIRVLAWQRLES
jgi:hypothetical protein